MDKSKLKNYTEKLRKYHREITEFYNDYAKSIGITMATLEVLSIINSEKECTQSTIVYKTYLPKQTVNAIIKTLNTNNLVEPLTELGGDKRSKIIMLTEKGIKFTKDAINKINEIENYALEMLGNKKCETLLSIMKEYLGNINKIKIENRG